MIHIFNSLQTEYRQEDAGGKNIKTQVEYVII